MRNEGQKNRLHDLDIFQVGRKFNLSLEYAGEDQIKMICLSIPDCSKNVAIKALANMTVLHKGRYMSLQQYIIQKRIELNARTQFEVAHHKTMGITCVNNMTGASFVEKYQIPVFIVSEMKA
jgi:hypothetical protein